MLESVRTLARRRLEPRERPDDAVLVRHLPYVAALTDDVLIRRRRLNVPDLYRVDGQFRYSGGFNWAGLAAWVVAGGVAAWWPQYAVLIGFPLGLILYVVLMRAVVLPNHRQAEIDSGFADRFLATSRGASWADIAGGHRLGREDL